MRFERSEKLCESKPMELNSGETMKLDYDPNVKTQIIKQKNEQNSDIQYAIDEIAKYPVKDTDFMTDDEEKNLISLSDLEEGDLIHTDNDEKADEYQNCTNYKFNDDYDSSNCIYCRYLPTCKPIYSIDVTNKLNGNKCYKRIYNTY
ncbi:hypothetical protein V2W34_11750 [Virgibacillus dokdonensis]|uniref:Uncharacterized protein n=1 Tax=Virgibacillus dokdonensis TaxID=302167 RepID=A0ABU7VG99_9BACI